MNFPVQHLSDEAVAAFADGMVSTAAQNRVVRHIAECGECAAAIAEQRAAASALRAAPTPAMPAGLLERLRAVPVTTPLTPQVMTLAPDGSAVFPAFGTGFGVAGPRAMSTSVSAPSVPWPHLPHLPHLPSMSRRGQQLALVAVAAAMITAGSASSAAAGSAGPSPVRTVPSGDANPGGSPVGLSTGRQNELVSSVSGKHN